MKHNLHISVSKKPVNRGIISVRNVSVREKIMRFLLGDRVKLTVLVPGNSVKGISITEIPDGGDGYE